MEEILLQRPGVVLDQVPRIVDQGTAGVLLRQRPLPLCQPPGQPLRHALGRPVRQDDVGDLVVDDADRGLRQGRIARAGSQRALTRRPARASQTGSLTRISGCLSGTGRPVTAAPAPRLRSAEMAQLPLQQRSGAATQVERRPRQGQRLQVDNRRLQIRRFAWVLPSPLGEPRSVSGART